MNVEPSRSELSGKTIAVTGATGFIGRYLIRALAARGARARAVVRRPETARAVFGPEVDVRRADLSDRSALARAFEGADAVMANAALISVASTDRARLVAANVEGVDNTYRAMADAGVRRAVHTSTAVAYVPKRGHSYREDDPLYPPGTRGHPLNHYGVSKAAGEHCARTLCERFGIDLSVGRPHTVFGNHDRGTFTRWFLRFLRPPVSLFPSHLFLPAIYAGDLAEAMCRMLERPAASGRAYHVCSDPDELSYWRLMRAYRQAGGRIPTVVVPVPVPIRRRYSTERMRADLDFAPRAPVDSFRHMLESSASAH
ncbi:MAG: NAD(P)-dependent oxidoreductase [Myxococcota bacterium]